MAPAPKYDQQTQQRMILSDAEQCINDSSVTDFTMAKVAVCAGLSMGSVYKFVQSKEDLVLALACESFRHASSIYEQVLSLPLHTPERVLAVCLVAPEKMQRFAFDYDLQSLSTNEAVIRRASPFWTEKVINTCGRCEELFKQTLLQSVDAKELLDVPNLDEIIEEIMISGWALNVGHDQVQRIQQTKQITQGNASLQAPLAINHPIIRSTVRLLNSYPWRYPITDESLTRIEGELEKLELR